MPQTPPPQKSAPSRLAARLAPGALPQSVKRCIALVATLLVLAYGAIILHTGPNFPPVAEAGFLWLVGVGAATIANATGVGGGVVFLPAFEFLGTQGHVAIGTGQIVAMSFIIQCFGMTTGSLNWLMRIYDHRAPDTGIPPGSFFRLITMVLATSLPVLLFTQAHLAAAPHMVLYWFKAISVLLGLTLLLTTLLSNGPRHERSSLTGVDFAVLALLGAIGGAATAFFSVGVGELVALYLFIRNFPLVTCAAAAVMVSAASVLTGVWHHILSAPQPWELLVFIVPGAVIGGMLARPFAYLLGARRLKLLAAGWITLSSLYLMIVA